MSHDNSQQINSQFILYQDDNGITNVNVRFDGQDVWLSQQQIAMLFDTTQQNISLHINGILDEGELSKEATHKYFLLVQKKTKEFEAYRRKEMLQYESDFDRAIRELKEQTNSNEKK